MRTRLISAVVCMLTLPLWFSSSPSHKDDPAPFRTVVYAGHTLLGDWCQCSTPGCLCDPGEVSGLSTKPVSDKTRRPLDQTASPIRARAGFDFGTGVLMLALAVFLWTRLRV